MNEDGVLMLLRSGAAVVKGGVALGKVLHLRSIGDIGAVGTGAVDREAHVIYGVSAMQAVEALGHGFDVDLKTLRQVAEFGNVAVGGIKCRYTHPGLSADGLGRLLGRMKDFRVVGDKVLGDLHFAESAAVSPEGDLRGYVERLCEEDPTAAGMSIVAYLDAAWLLENAEDPEGAPVEVYGSAYERPEGAINKLPLARLRWQELATGEKMNPLRAVDLVDEPAANREGMFSAGTTNPLCAVAFHELDRHQEELLEGGDVPATLRDVVMNFCEVHGIEWDKASAFIEGWRDWRRLRGLAVEAGGLDAAGGEMSDVSADVVVEAGEAGVELEAEVSPRAPGLFARLRAALSNNESMTSRIAELEGKVLELAAVKAELAEAVELAEEQAGRIERLEAEARVASLRAVDLLAEAGVPAELVPSPGEGEDAALSASDLPDLRKRLKTETDQLKRAALLARIKEARGWKVTD
jgi:hypothetical protein